MHRAVFRFLSLVFGLLPASPAHKEAFKAFVYRNFGWLFGRSLNYGDWLRANPSRQPRRLAAHSVEPPASAWSALAARGAEPTPDTAASLRGRPYILVPVYRGRAETLACLYSVRLSAPGLRLVVIDDATPDRPLRARLGELASAGHFELLRNESNQGFLRSVNRGIDLDPDADIVLLNSDTEVFGDWLARLNAAAYREPDVGTVTPLSNNGDIASYPHRQRDNRLKLELDFRAIDDLARQANGGLGIEAPTGVGFCLYIRRACLSDTGRFDEHFAAGYGEENDFCLRARKAGWRSLIAADVYVRHTGSISFGRRVPWLRAKALNALVERHASYPAEVEDFVRRDPTRSARLRLDVARLRRSQPVEAPIHSLLFVVHEWGGGIEQHVSELATRLIAENVAVYTLRVQRGSDPPRLRLAGPPGAPALEEVPTMDDIALEGRDEIVDALRLVDIDHVHIHHPGEMAEIGAGWLGALCAELGAPYDVTLHDYVPICPRLHLEDPTGHYCGEPDLEVCERCLATHGSRFGAPDLGQWRKDWRALLAGARRVICPSEDLRARLAARWPEPSYLMRGHPEARSPRIAAIALATRSSTKLRVLVPGAIDEKKGLGLLLACAEDARARSLPLEFWIVGYSGDDARAARAGIKLTGRYAPGGDDRAIAAALARPGAAFLPSLLPETWSYVLSSVLRVGLHPVVFDLGALAERVRSAGRGTVLPLELSERPNAVNDALLDRKSVV